MKRLVIACDGTWQTLAQPHPTNVRRIAQAVAPRDGQVEQLVYYASGLGVGSVVDRWLGGAFGAGLSREIMAAYAALCANYHPGDEIYLFGFSRGAYTVRSLAGLIWTCGILRREHLSRLPEAYALYRRPGAAVSAPAHVIQARYGHGPTSAALGASPISITFLGVWDTVGALGVPDLTPLIPLDRWSMRRYRFHNTCVSPVVACARHAVAIDEHRTVFRHTDLCASDLIGAPSPASTVRQVWFPGDHGCVGGGGEDHEDPSHPSAKRPFADAALAWMIDETPGLKIDREKLGLAPNALAPMPLAKGRYRRRLSKAAEPGPQDRRTPDLRPLCAVSDIHASALERWRVEATYRPDNLAAVIAPPRRDMR